MDASAYNMSFDKEQLALLCANYDRRIDALARENARLKAENDKLRELVDALMGCGTRYHTMSGACPMFDANAKDCCKAEEIARELGLEAG